MLLLIESWSINWEETRVRANSMIQLDANSINKPILCILSSDVNNESNLINYSQTYCKPFSKVITKSWCVTTDRQTKTALKSLNHTTDHRMHTICNNVNDFIDKVLWKVVFGSQNRRTVLSLVWHTNWTLSVFLETTYFKIVSPKENFIFQVKNV